MRSDQSTWMFALGLWLMLAPGVEASGLGGSSRTVYFEMPLCAPFAPAAVCCPAPIPPCDVPTPVIGLKLLAPACVNLGEEVEYCILVENRSEAAAHHVTVRNPLPANARYVRATPAPSAGPPDLVWQLGTMPPCSQKVIKLVLVPTGPGDLNNCARVTFEHGLCVATKVCEPPKPNLTLRKQGPAEAQLFDMINYQLVVTNTGDGPATNVVLTDTLPAGLEHQSGQKQLSWNLGTLPPHTSRAVDYQVVAKANGRHCNRAVVTATGNARAEVEACVNVIEAKLNLAKIGPRRVYINSEVPYKVTVTNAGNAVLTNVTLRDQLPTGVTFVSASDGGRVSGAQVVWSLGTLPVGASKTVDVTVRARAPGTLVNLAEATADRGLKANGEARTEVVGAPALLLEVVDTVDPVAVGEDTQYNIIIANQGSVAATNVRIVAVVPAELAIVRVQGPVDHKKDGQTIRFEPITLETGKDTVLRVFVRGVKPGDVRFRVSLTADQLPAGPVLEEESTNVFDDRAPRPK